MHGGRAVLGIAATFVLGAVLALPPGRAPAQQPQPAPTPPRPAAPPAAAAAQGGANGAGAPPERTSALFGDWSVHCVARAPEAGGGRVCEMSQTVTEQQRQQPVAVLALGRIARDQPTKLVARVPVNVQVASPARLLLDGPAGPANEPLALAFRSCSPLGCFAEAELAEAALRRLRARPAEQGGRVAWREATGAEAAVPVSFRGFGAAYEALLREGG